MLFAGFASFQPARWGFWLKLVLTPVIVLAGMIGNTLSLIVMKSKKLRHKSYSQYLSALSIFDTFTLVIRQMNVINEYTREEHHTDIIFQHFDDFGCKLFNYIEHVSYLMSSWLIVMMSVERVIAVCMPFKKFRIRKKAGATLTILALFTTICLSQTFRLVMIEQLEPTGCGASNDFLHVYSNLHIYFYYMALTFVLPVGFVFVCNGLVLYQIFKVRREIISRVGKRDRHQRAIRKTHRTTCMLLTVSFTFLGTLLPLLILSLVVDCILKARGPAAFNFYISVKPFLDLTEVLSLINYAANFYIYILSGKNFRYELQRVFNRHKMATRSFTGKSSKDTKEEIIRLWFKYIHVLMFALCNIKMLYLHKALFVVMIIHKVLFL